MSVLQTLPDIKHASVVVNDPLLYAHIKTEWSAACLCMFLSASSINGGSYMDSVFRAHTVFIHQTNSKTICLGLLFSVNCHLVQLKVTRGVGPNCNLDIHSHSHA